MKNFEILNNLNSKIIGYKYNQNHPVYYIYIGPILGFNNPSFGIFLNLSDKLLASYEGNEVYNLINTIIDNTYNVDLIEGLSNFKLGEDYLLSQSLYNMITNSEEDCGNEINLELGIMPDYIDKYLFCNYNAYINNMYTNNKDISNIDYFYKMNKMNDYTYSSEELDNFYMTFCNIILENTSLNIYAQDDYIYYNVLNYFRNGSTDDAQSGIQLILGSTFGSSTINTYSSCGCSQTNNTTTDTSCFNLYKNAMKTYLIKMLGNKDFYNNWFTTSLDNIDKSIPNLLVIDSLIKLIDEFISMNYNLTFTTQMSKCNCEQITPESDCNIGIIKEYKNVLQYIKNNDIDANINKIKVYGEAFGELLPNLQF